MTCLHVYYEEKRVVSWTMHSSANREDGRPCNSYGDRDTAELEDSTRNEDRRGAVQKTGAFRSKARCLK